MRKEIETMECILFFCSNLVEERIDNHLFVGYRTGFVLRN